MNTPAPSPGVSRRLLGIALTFVLIASTIEPAQEMGYMGSTWAAAAVASGLLLLVAAWKNWPLLWNPLGRMMRNLLGERWARVAFGAVAVVFAMSAVLPMLSGPRICAKGSTDAQQVAADSSVVPRC